MCSYIQECTILEAKLSNKSHRGGNGLRDMKRSWGVAEACQCEAGDPSSFRDANVIVFSCQVWDQQIT